MEIEMLINKKNLWVMSVIPILLSLVSCNKDKIENVNDDYILQVTAFIDGRDRLHITRGGFFWEHLEYSAVGLWQGKNEPTIFSFYMNNESQVNRYTWFPEWTSESKDIKKGSLTNLHEVEGFKLPQHGFYVELEKLAGDGPVRIIQAPLRENNYETIIDFYDSGGGAEFYTINIIFHAKPPYNGKFIEEQYSKIVQPPKESNILPVSKLENAELHVIGVYEGVTENYEEEQWWKKCDNMSIYVCHDLYANTHPEGRVKVVIDAYSKPIILGLSAYDPVHWIIDAPEKSKIEKVILSGYYKQRVSGLPDNTLLEIHSREKYPCDSCTYGKGVFYSYKKPSENYQKLTGLKPSTFQGKYTGDTFRLSDGILQSQGVR
jgi:hypothetical protein